MSPTRRQRGEGSVFQRHDHPNTEGTQPNGGTMSDTATPPLLATRDALAKVLAAVYVDHPMWTHKGAVWTCRCGASLGRFNDPVTSKPIEPLPLWHAHVAEVQADALALAAELTEGPS